MNLQNFLDPRSINQLMSCLPGENRRTWLSLNPGRWYARRLEAVRLHLLWFFMGHRSKRARCDPLSRSFSFKPLTPARVWLLDSFSWPEADLMRGRGNFSWPSCLYILGLASRSIHFDLEDDERCAGESDGTVSRASNTVAERRQICAVGHDCSLDEIGRILLVELDEV